MSEEKKEWDAAYYRAAAESAERMMEVAGSIVVSSQACARDLAMAARDVEVLERERDEARAELALLTEERNRLRAALRLAHSGIRVYRQSTPCSSDHRPGDLYEECRGCGFHVILETAQAALRAGLERLCSNPVCTAPVAAGASRCTACARFGRGEEAPDA